MMHNTPHASLSRPWRVRGELVSWPPMPSLMGIVNVTPDSFSDGGRFVHADQAVEHALALVEQGADVLDVGGESTRPGAEPVSADEELQRVIPVIAQLAGVTDVPVSIDTMKATVAREGLQAGATIVNDVSGLRFDPNMPAVCADADCGVICMHMQGTPQTMQDDPRYGDVVSEIVAFFRERLSALEAEGIAAERIVLDPGIGFGKTAAHNHEILSHIARFHELGRPLLIGHSRKRFLGKLLSRPIEERTSGTIGVAIALAEQGVEMLRVHDVRAVKDALTAWEAVQAGSSKQGVKARRR